MQYKEKFADGGGYILIRPKRIVLKRDPRWINSLWGYSTLIANFF